MDKRSFRFILLIITISIFLIFSLWNITSLFKIISDFLKIIRPLIFGFVLAFILYQPFIKLKRLFRRLFKKCKTDKLATALAAISVYLLFILVITSLIIIIIPQFSKSISLLQVNFDGYISNFKNFTNDTIQKINNLSHSKFNITDKLYSYLEKAPDFISKLFLGAFGFTTSIIGTVIDVLLGIIISMYFLLGKGKLDLQGKKIVFALFKEEKAKKIVSFSSTVAQTFTNFITGQIIEAFILGTLCFIGMNIFGFEYAFLISVLVGATNMVPIVGPFIGTVPSFLLLLLVNPVMALWFLVFILILQQLESNLIYPRVVGTKVGLPALWVLVSVIVGGGLFGLIGMLLAVPTMSIIYDITRKNVKKKLTEKHISVE